jgi:CRISPR-associated protein Cas2
MAARTIYLVCYDICDSPARLTRVRNYLKGYAVAGQYSFYECWLTPAEYRTVQAWLQHTFKADTDRVHLLQLDPRMPRQGFGVAEFFEPGPFFIV